MSKRKMCEYYKSQKKTWYGGHCFRPNSIDCPSNTNSKCEIIKPKERYKRVSAVGWWNCWDSCFVATSDIKNKPNYKRDGVEGYPCFILIDRKHLGGK